MKTWDQRYTYECFHNLDIEVINAEIKALHFSAHLFYEKTEVKTKLLSIFQDFATAKNYNLLKIGKLNSSSTQKQTTTSWQQKKSPKLNMGLLRILYTCSHFETDYGKGEMILVEEVFQ